MSLRQQSLWNCRNLTSLYIYFTYSVGLLSTALTPSFHRCCFSTPLSFPLLFIPRPFKLLVRIGESKVRPVSSFLLASDDKSFGWREEANLLPREATEFSTRPFITHQPLTGIHLQVGVSRDLLPGAGLSATVARAAKSTVDILNRPPALHAVQLKRAAHFTTGYKMDKNPESHKNVYKRNKETSCSEACFICSQVFKLMHLME